MFPTGELLRLLLRLLSAFRGKMTLKHAITSHNCASAWKGREYSIATGSNCKSILTIDNSLIALILEARSACHCFNVGDRETRRRCSRVSCKKDKHTHTHTYRDVALLDISGTCSFISWMEILRLLITPLKNIFRNHVISVTSEIPRSRLPSWN